MNPPSAFSEIIIRWQKRHGRRDLPWQKTRDPYRIWLSEIMLQQTQVKTVIPYYTRFLARFPDLGRLSCASEDAVLSLWSGLGYYSRARNLLSSARLIRARHGDRFPRDFESILALPGVGRSTAGAISVFAFNRREPILDANVRRVLTRHFGLVNKKAGSATDKLLWTLARRLLPMRDLRAYTQGLMDLGATLCVSRQPECNRCPLHGRCKAAHASDPGRRKPGRSAPKKIVTLRWLLLKKGQSFLLEKRMGPGIWRGLYAFPELPARAAPVGYIRKAFGLKVRVLRPFPAFDHELTHRRLRISPLLCRVVTGSVPAVLKPFAPAHFRNAPFPEPVKTLLTGFLNNVVLP